MRDEVVEGAIDGARWDIARGGGGRSEGDSEGAWDRDTMMNVDVGSRAGSWSRDTPYIPFSSFGDKRSYGVLHDQRARRILGDG